MKRIYILLAGPTTAQDVNDALQDVASPWGGRKVDSSYREPNPYQRCFKFEAAGSSTSVTLIADDIAQALFLLVEGENGGETLALGYIAETRLATTPVAQALKDAEANYRASPHLLVRASLVADTRLIAPTLALLERASRDTEKSVRTAAINAIALTQWPEALAVLAEREANESDPELRKFVKQASASLRSALGKE
jgi:hypothetical protein